MPDASQEMVQSQASARRRGHPVAIGGAVLALAILALILVWKWDWFIPLLDARASAVLGRQVTITHLHVRLGRTTIVRADDVTIANPEGFPPLLPLAHLHRLTVAADVMDYFRSGAMTLPYVDIDRPDIAATVLPDGRNNFIVVPHGASGNRPPPRIGDVRVEDGRAHVVDPRHKSDFSLTIATREATGSAPAAITVQARVFMPDSR